MELANLLNVQRDTNYLITFSKDMRHLTLLRHRHHNNNSSNAAMLYRRSATTSYMLDTNNRITFSKDMRLPTLRLHHHRSSNSAAPLYMLHYLDFVIKILTTRVEHIHQCPLLSARQNTPSRTPTVTIVTPGSHHPPGVSRRHISPI